MPISTTCLYLLRGFTCHAYIIPISFYLSFSLSLFLFISLSFYLSSLHHLKNFRKVCLIIKSIYIDLLLDNLDNFWTIRSACWLIHRLSHARRNTYIVAKNMSKYVAKNNKLIKHHDPKISDIIIY